MYPSQIIKWLMSNNAWQCWYFSPTIIGQQFQNETTKLVFYAYRVQRNLIPSVEVLTLLLGLLKTSTLLKFINNWNDFEKHLFQAFASIATEESIFFRNQDLHRFRNRLIVFSLLIPAMLTCVVEAYYIFILFYSNHLHSDDGVLYEMGLLVSNLFLTFTYLFLEYMDDVSTYFYMTTVRLAFRKVCAIIRFAKLSNNDCRQIVTYVKVTFLYVLSIDTEWDWNKSSVSSKVYLNLQWC